MKKIVINFGEPNIQIALLDEDKLIEMIIEKEENKSCVGNIYAGIVKNVLPSRFVFVDIGQEKNAFLYLEDNRESYLIENGQAKIKNGQQILVQVMKDAVGDKGVGVTTQLSFSSKNMVVFLEGSNADVVDIGISKKIEDRNERKRLKEIAQGLVQKGYGMIMRTDSVGKSKEELAEEFNRLLLLCQKIMEQGKYVKAPAVIYKEDYILNSTLKELLKEDVDSIYLNSEKDFQVIQNLAKEMRGEQCQLTLVKDKNSIFSKFMIDTQLKKVFNKKVWLKSGGFIIIEQTEACVVIDVNSGKFSGGYGQQDYVLRTNIEAAEEIAYQLRLRNLAGIIIIDFIDMKREKDKDFLIHVLTSQVKKDRISVSVVGMTQLGLMQLTRKKTRLPVTLADFETCCSQCGAPLSVQK